MLFKLNITAVFLLASIALSKAFNLYEPVYSDRDFVENVDELSARSHIDAALSSLSTRALIEELQDRLEARGPGVDRHAQAVERCRRLLYTARDKWVHGGQKVAANASVDGKRPVEDWQYEPTPPPSPRMGAARA
ncbi:hypothetical protein NMY22_g2602 [Coprinellus aureogranulatus]|nr:hypothetical protein NMY22_g2602 [Coprinellus aureogranulatus]